MIDWAPWGRDAFARAAREQKPVLLSITAAWCRACHEMDRTTYADEVVAAVIRERFVPVRVDTDRRPDINERYNLGGWPTTAFLTGEGELITGGTFVAVERMPGVLSRVADAYAAASGSGLTSRSPASGSADPSVASGVGGPRPSPGSAAGRGDSDATLDSIFSTFDEAYGGFGVEPKFPHTAAVHLALTLYQEAPSDRWRTIAQRTLDGMADGGLWDAENGGFFRYATTRDWQLPHREKLLETNAALLRLYADAARILGREIDGERCVSIAEFITRGLRADGGGYYGSDAEPILYADANASAVSALLAASALLRDAALGQEALASLERVTLGCYTPGHGIAHYLEGGTPVRGLLTDQLATINAMLDAYEASGGEPYKMMAEELGHYVARHMRDESDGGCFDRAVHADDLGLLRRPHKPFIANVEAAMAFARLERVGGEGEFRAYATGALHAAAQQLTGQGPEAARYVLAARQLTSPMIDS